MDSNKDAAQRCLDMGYKALNDGDKVRAHRFLAKALRLDPNLPLQEVLSSLSEEMEERGSDNMKFPSEKEPNKDFREHEGNTSNSAPKPSSGFPADQVEIVRSIRKTKDYYQILGLSKNCSAEEVRKAYRKISLKVHPDKNKAPGAEEAFKAVSKAFACLSDPELRKRYDQYGPEETFGRAHQQTTRRYSNGFTHEEMFDADQIFNSFFFGTTYASNSFQGVRFMRTHRTAGGAQVVHSGGLLKLLQLLPILALFLFTYFPFSTPVYSLEQFASYTVQYWTREHAVPFFVKSQAFDKDYPPGSRSRRSIEAQVERDYREILGHNCRRELNHQFWNPSIKTPNCDMLRRFQVY